jgi:hypothetical protein
VRRRCRSSGADRMALLVGSPDGTLPTGRSANRAGRPRGARPRPCGGPNAWRHRRRGRGGRDAGGRCCRPDSSPPSGAAC